MMAAHGVVVRDYSAGGERDGRDATSNVVGGVCVAGCDLVCEPIERTVGQRDLVDQTGLKAVGATVFGDAGQPKLVRT